MYQPTELGPESLLWRWAGDTRIAFMGGTIGLLQTMHPAIGAALVDHSNFFEDPADRVFRSLPAILGTIYDADGVATGREVRDRHRTIKGVGANGASYHALQPDTYWWAHATFQYMVEQVADRFDRHRLIERERDQLYTEGLEWYRRYGVSDRPAPATRAAFQQGWDRVCEEVLQPNEATDWLIETMLAKRMPKMGTVPNLPTWTEPVLATRLMRRLLQPGVRLTSFGGLPPVVRHRFGIPWTTVDQFRLGQIERAIRTGWWMVPPALRWQPRARAGWQRARADARASERLGASVA